MSSNIVAPRKAPDWLISDRDAPRVDIAEEFQAVQVPCGPHGVQTIMFYRNERLTNKTKIAVAEQNDVPLRWPKSR